MTVYYVDTFATNNGNGLASNQAASPGASGAYNSLLEILKGTAGYGSVAAGDVFHIRTHNGTTNATETIASAGLTKTVTGGETNPARFIFDDGVIWPDAGSFTIVITSGATSYTMTLSGMEFLAKKRSETDYGLVFHKTSATSSHLYSITGALLRFRGMRTKFESKDCRIAIGSSSDNHDMILEDCLLQHQVGATALPLFGSGRWQNYSLQNVIIDVTGSDNNAGVRLLTPSTSGWRFRMTGGAIKGMSAAQHMFVATTAYQDSMDIEFIGTDLSEVPLTCITSLLATYSALGMDRKFMQASSMGGRTDAFVMSRVGYSRWYESGNYPTLSATLPRTDAAPWSMQIMSAWGNRIQPYEAPKAQKMCVLSGTTDRTVTCRFLGLAVYGTLTNDNVWFEVSYVAADGAMKNVSTRAPTPADIANIPVDASPQAWTGYSEVTGKVGYATNNYDAYSVSIPLPGGVKQNSMVIVGMFVGVNAPGVETDFFFFDPNYDIA